MKKPKRRREVREAVEISRGMASPKGQKVFISWSGDYSKQLAAAIKEWLPMVLQSVDIYFSDTDIEVGSTWYNTDFGISHPPQAAPQRYCLLGSAINSFM